MNLANETEAKLIKRIQEHLWDSIDKLDQDILLERDAYFYILGAVVRIAVQLGFTDFNAKEVEDKKEIFIKFIYDNIEAYVSTFSKVEMH